MNQETGSRKALGAPVWLMKFRWEDVTKRAGPQTIVSQTAIIADQDLSAQARDSSVDAPWGCVHFSDLRLVALLCTGGIRVPRDASPLAPLHSLLLWQQLQQLQLCHRTTGWSN